MDTTNYDDLLDLFDARIRQGLDRTGKPRKQPGDPVTPVEITIFANSHDYDAANGWKWYGVDWGTHCRLCGDLADIYRRRGYDVRLVIGDDIDTATVKQTRQDALTRIRTARNRRDKARAEASSADEALRAATLAALAAGVPVKDAAREARVSRQTIHKWRDKGAGHD